MRLICSLVLNYRVWSFARPLAILPVLVLLIAFPARSTAADDLYDCPHLNVGTLGPGEALIIGRLGESEWRYWQPGDTVNLTFTRSPVTTIRVLRPFNASIPQQFLLLEQAKTDPVTWDDWVRRLMPNRVSVMWIRRTSKYGASFELMGGSECSPEPAAGNSQGNN